LQYNEQEKKLQEKKRGEEKLKEKKRGEKRKRS
jgi:hypothetical protein